MHEVAQAADWTALGESAVSLLQDLLRFDTSNPPGDEADCARYVADRLQRAGVDPRVIESAPNRANVVGRLRGDGTGGGPLLLNAHLDVVPAETDRWTHPPFGGEIHDGYVWGRGAVDMKNMAAMCLAVVELLADADVRLTRDVVFAAVADEEAGCAHGSRYLAEEHPDEVRAEYALGEVGGFTLRVGDATVYPVQVAEKGVCWLRATAEGTTGHGSLPREDNAVVLLSRFLSHVGRTSLPLHLSEPAERQIRALADTQPRPLRTVLLGLLQTVTSPVLIRAMRMLDPATARTLHAILHNTVSPTMLDAGFKTNVIPATATAGLDGRIAVGSSADELVSELRSLAGEHISFEVVKSHPPTASSPDTPLFETISDVVTEHHPGAVSVPTVIPGFTDAHYWSRLGATCYGFSPVRLDEDEVDFMDLFHADDERVPVAGFRAGLKMLADVVLRTVT